MLRAAGAAAGAPRQGRGGRAEGLVDCHTAPRRLRDAEGERRGVHHLHPRAPDVRVMCDGCAAALKRT